MWEPIQKAFSDWWAEALVHLPRLFVMMAVAVVLVGLLLVLDRALKSRERTQQLSLFWRHIWMLLATVGALLIVAVSSPDPAMGVQAVAVVASIVLTLASSTLASNGLAGMLMRAQRHFRIGDYLRVGDEFGKVSGRGLFFTEIENELADLVTLPNSYLLTKPVTVIDHDRTLISTDVSLGYDVSRHDVDSLLRQAAQDVGVKPDHCFVRILALGDFSVQYRLSAELEKVDRLLSAKSELNGAVLDALHGAGIEIVSPTVMNQRQLTAGELLIPRGGRSVAPESPVSAEDLMFQKALEGETIEKLAEELAGNSTAADKLREDLRAADRGQRDSIKAQITRIEARAGLIQERIGQLKEKAETPE